MRVNVAGAGIVGLTAALALAKRGAEVAIYERRAGPGLGCSFLAGGMIAPWCERESADELVCAMGQEALAFWTNEIPVATVAGSLVVTPARDRAELKRFAARTNHHEMIGDGAVGALEPDLAGRFSSALYFAEEAHLEPRAAISALAAALGKMPNVAFHYGADAPPPGAAGWTVDARGFAAKDALPALRGVKGEMVVLRTADVSLSRPVRMVHPRHPVYIVPRPDQTFMIGATMIENEEPGRVTARALLELLGAAYTLHPAFGDAEVIETGCDLRPAFADNLPRLVRMDRVLYINGLFRHGFLLSPALARRAADIVFDDAYFPELMDEHQRERRQARG